MAFKQLGTPNFAKGINTEITIEGVTIFSSANTTKGFRNITEIIGHDGETAAVVMAGEDNLDVTINGYLDEPTTEKPAPKNGDTATVEGYDIAWIDGVSISETPDGVTTISATVHARKPTA